MTTTASEALDLATGNARFLLAALARTRGQELVDRPAFTAMVGPRLVRVLLLGAAPDAGSVAEIGRLVAAAPGKVVVEDPYSTVDGGAWGRVPRNLPVMIRPPAPLPEPHLEVVAADAPEQWAVAERVIIDGF